MRSVLAMDKALDTSPAEFGELKRLLNKFLSEESGEAEHQEAQPTVKAAGVVFVYVGPGDPKVLLLKRSLDEENYAGYWSVPGGNLDGDETPDQAVERECREEIGGYDDYALEHYQDTSLPDGTAHVTFRAPVEQEFTPELNVEHTEFGWFPLGELPKPVHPGVKQVLGRLALEGATDFSLDEQERKDNGQFGSGSGGGKEGLTTVKEKTAPPFVKETMAKYNTGAKLKEYMGTVPTEKLKQGIKLLDDHGVIDPGSNYVKQHMSEELKRRGGQDKALDRMPEEFKERVRIAKERTGLAYDKSARVKTIDGYLMREACNISKACISPYRGEEVPNYQALGLAKDKIYQMFRDPAELAKGAHTFNGLPLFIIHEGNSAEDHRTELVVGATGTNAKFVPPYLQNDLVIWPQEAIDGVESDEQKEISCGYRYDPDMTPGVYEGKPYDGVMRGIVGNHVALVEEGRAGPDVVVGDHKERTMTKPVTLSRTAIRVQGALHGVILPKLATDSALKYDLSAILAKVTRKNIYAKDGKLKLPALKAIIKLARDMAEPLLDPAAVAAAGEAPGGAIGPDDVIMKLVEHAIAGGAAEAPELDELMPSPLKAAGEGQAGTPAGGEEGAGAGEGGKSKKVVDWLKSKGMDCSMDDIAQLEAIMGGSEAAPAGGGAEGEEVEDEDLDDKEKDKKAMDKMIKSGALVSRKAMDAAMTEQGDRIRAEMRELAETREFVKLWVGDSAMSLDTADKVLRASLENLGVDAAGVKETAALRAILAQVPKPGSTRITTDAAVAMDGATAKSLEERFPAAARIRIAG